MTPLGWLHNTPTFHRSWQTNRSAADWNMRGGKILLAGAGSLSILTGAFMPAPQKLSRPLQMFADAKPSDFVGDQRCAGCHEETVQAFPQSAHAIYMRGENAPLGKRGCEACHGPGKPHIETDTPLPKIISYPRLSAVEVIDTCLRCHGDIMKKPHFRMETHARVGLSCISCHQIHPKNLSLAGDRGNVKKPVFAATKDSNPLLRYDEATLCNQCHQSVLSSFRKISHHPIPEGRMNCSDCHSIHPTTSDNLKKSLLKENCVTCHAEVAGPFVYEHDPVAGWTGGGCGECHNPHGTQNQKLLVISSRGLCMQCHTDKGGNSHFPGLTCWTAGCHVAVHGSNTDPRLLKK